MDSGPNHPQALIAGFGVPGRAAADALKAAGVPFVIIELNPANVDRCSRAGLPMICGDVRDEQILRQAGICHASLLILAMPDDAVCLAAIEAARKLNPTVKIVARCTFTSAGLQAGARGAAHVIVAEQVVARELTQVLEHHLAMSGKAPQVF